MPKRSPFHGARTGSAVPPSQRPMARSPRAATRGTVKGTRAARLMEHASILPLSATAAPSIAFSESGATMAVAALTSKTPKGTCRLSVTRCMSTTSRAAPRKAGVVPGRHMRTAAARTVSTTTLRAYVARRVRHARTQPVRAATHARNEATRQMRPAYRRSVAVPTLTRQRYKSTPSATL